jgi:predicted dinucleotide-binding enzyme
MQTTRRIFNTSIAALTIAAIAPVRGKDMKARKIGVIGAGSLGGTIGGLWVEAGHEVMFSSRHPEELAGMAKALGPRATTGTAKRAAVFGEILLFAVPYDALAALGTELRDEIRGKVVLDSCNPSAARFEAIASELGTRNAGEMTDKLLPGVRLVRTFSAVDATSAEASFRRGKDRLGVPLAGDDAAAVEIAAQLVRDAGCEPVITGRLATAVRFQRGTPAFRANTTAAELKRRLAESGS